MIAATRADFLAEFVHSPLDLRQQQPAERQLLVGVQKLEQGVLLHPLEIAQGGKLQPNVPGQQVVGRADPVRQPGKVQAEGVAQPLREARALINPLVTLLATGVKIFRQTSRVWRC